MLRTISITAAALATLISATAPGVASAQRYGGGYDDGRYAQAYQDAYRDGYNQSPRGYDRSGYDERGGYYERGDYRHQRGYRRCSDGTAGTIIGAIAGGLLGSAVAGRGDHTLGTVLGAGGGALAGRAVERDGCR